jgi:hypothetical protein
MKRLLLLLFLSAIPAFGQGIRVDQYGFVDQSGIVHVIPNAPVTVCTNVATGIPCSPTISIYSDIALTIPIAQPGFTADVHGNIGFYFNPTALVNGAIRYSISPTSLAPSGGLFTLTPGGGNAPTATALAGTPTLCSVGNAPVGILPNGNATGCAPITGGGSGCTISGPDMSVVTVHPFGTCFSSADFTWDDTTPTVGGIAGDNLFAGQSNTYTFTGTGTAFRRLADSRILGNGNQISGLSNNPNLTRISIVGPVNQVSVDGTSTSGSQFTSVATATLAGNGNSIIATLQGHIGPVGTYGSANSIQATAPCTITNAFSYGVANVTSCGSTGTTMTNVVAVGRNNTLGSTGGSAFSDINIFGQNDNLTNCSTCYLFGDSMAPGGVGPGYIGIGLSATPEIAITPGNVVVNGSIALKTIATASDCEVNSVSPAACLAACAGSFVVPTTTTTYTVNTTCPTTNSSKFFLFPRTDATGLPLAPTCVTPAITSSWNRSAHANNVSFTVAIPSTVGQTCWDFLIVSN